MNKKQNDGLALVVGGLFILALVFATYNYFNKGKDSQDTLEKRIEQMQKEQGKELGDKEELSESTTDNEQGDLNGEGTTTIRTEEQAEQTAPVWTANDYNKGEITGETYTVKAGDTLWEIAEGITGNGADWVQLLNANSDDIGYLANGQQALIVPGQVLNIRM